MKDKARHFPVIMLCHELAQILATRADGRARALQRRLAVVEGRA